MFRAVQIIFFVLGALFALGADKLSMPILMYGGVSCFGVSAMAIGWEAIVTRQIQLGRRRSGTQQTYIGFPAILQGIQFNLIGLFLIGASGFFYLSNEQESHEIFLHFIRRPGFPLTLIGLLILLQSLVVFLGYQELNEGDGWIIKVNLLISRLLPGLILLVLGFGLIVLGLLEMVTPAVFDSIGGGFLEVLYGLK